MPLTDQDILEEIQYHLLEPPNSGASMESDIWKLSEVIDALNEAQRELLKATGVVQTHATVPHTPGAVRHPLLAGTIDVTFVIWRGQDGTDHPLHRVDTWALDHGLPAWQTTPGAHPLYYQDGEVPQLVVATAPPANAAGTLHVIYTALSTLLSNSGIAFAVPAACVAVVKWRALEILLRKAGRGQDAARADYCAQRYEEGLLGVAALLEGGV